MSTCECGMAVNDPLHRTDGGWHKLLLWNQGVYALAREERERQFDKRLSDEAERDKRRRKDEPTGPTLVP